jgi:hypothetical protein
VIPCAGMTDTTGMTHRVIESRRAISLVADPLRNLEASEFGIANCEL